MSKPNTIEGVYCGLLESVRRVDNFPKPESVAKSLTVDGVIAMIDNKLVEYKVGYDLLDAGSDDLEVGAIEGSIEALESLKENILKVYKGE